MTGVRVKPRLFVGSSTEGLDVAYAIQANLDFDAEVTVWPQDVFRLSSSAIDDLLRVLETNDFGVFVFTPDDLIKMKGTEVPAARDNVVFELGLFIGRLGKERTFIVIPRGPNDLHLPTDLTGITPGSYDPHRSDNNLKAALGPFCNDVKKAMDARGVSRASPKIVVPDTPRAAHEKGVKKVAGLFARAYGPHGSIVSLTLESGEELVSRKGSIIVRGVRSLDVLESKGIASQQAVVTEMQERVGDGTAMVVLLTAALLEAGYAALDAGHRARDVATGIAKGMEAAITLVEKSATPTAGKRELEQIATTASGSVVVGKLLVEALDVAGKDLVLTVESSNGIENYLATKTGFEFDSGYLSHYFITDPVEESCRLEDCFILLYPGKISGIWEILPIMESVARSSKPLLVIAQDVEGEALATLITNHARKTLQSVAVKAPGSGTQRRSWLEDLAVITGAQLVAPELGRSLETVSLNDLGRAARVIVEKDRTLILQGAGSPKAIEERLSALRHASDHADSDFDRELVRRRIQNLNQKAVTIFVGGVTPGEVGEARQQVESALHAAIAAISQGFVTGGGRPLLDASLELAKVEASNAAERAGIDAVARALTAPIGRLIANAKLEEADVLAQIATAGAGHVALNVDSGRVEDLRQAGILDPVRVLSVAMVIAAAQCRQRLQVDAWDS